MSVKGLILLSVYSFHCLHMINIVHVVDLESFTFFDSGGKTVYIITRYRKSTTCTDLRNQ